MAHRSRSVYFPEDGDAVQDSPRLTMVVLDPSEEWREGGQLSDRISRWTKETGQIAATLPRSVGVGAQ